MLALDLSISLFLSTSFQLFFAKALNILNTVCNDVSTGVPPHARKNEIVDGAVVKGRN